MGGGGGGIKPTFAFSFFMEKTHKSFETSVNSQISDYFEIFSVSGIILATLSKKSALINFFRTIELIIILSLENHDLKNSK
jgi:hypothetical protein